jgi:O-antigen/teichoic acid export membrane protein
MSKDVVLTLADRYIGALTTIGSSVVLARLLAPDQVGVASLALAFVAIAHIFRDMGLTTYVMSRAKIDIEDLSPVTRALVGCYTSFGIFPSC